MNLDWHKILIGDLDFSFAIEIAMRSLVMFIMVLLILRLSGKKGVRQLSLFEVAIIISLGSAAGDPMFNEDVAILPAILVFATILLFYRLITYYASISERFEKLLEGDSMYIVEDGRFVVMDEHEHTFAKDEFFAEMRQASIEHVGQVRTAILESNGSVSFTAMMMLNTVCQSFQKYTRSETAQSRPRAFTLAPIVPTSKICVPVNMSASGAKGKNG